MVYELTDELARCPETQLDELSIAIENLLIGYYEGNMILLISRPLSSFIKAKGLYKSDRAQKALYAIDTNGVYVPDVLWHIKIVLDKANPEKHEVEYVFFSRTIAIQPTAFLCENLTDVKFYMKLSRLYYPETPMRAFYFHGGGGTIADVLSLLIRQKMTALVILDSDVKYPGCDIGETAKRCLSCYKRKVGYIEVKVLDVHEAENLVPIAFMRDCSSRQGSLILKRMTDNRVLDSLVYYDVKNGIKKNSVSVDLKYKEYCAELYTILYRPRINNFEKYYSQKTDEKDYLFAQIDGNLLEKFVQDKTQAYPGDAMSPYREKIAELVHTFVCCRGDDPLN